MTDPDRAKERRRARKRKQAKRKNAFFIVRFFALAILILIVGIGVIGSILRPDVIHLPVNKHVQSYEPVIEKYAEKYGIKEYVDLAEAVMMQESHGKGTDPMQSSEGNYNKKYPSDPGGITDPEYSIDCGVHQLAEVLEAAGCKSTHDSQGIKLALQGVDVVLQRGELLIGQRGTTAFLTLEGLDSEDGSNNREKFLLHCA